MADFEFTLEEDGAINLRSAIFQALGAASMCWTQPPEGAFDSERAEEIGDYLFGFLDALIDGAQHALSWCSASPDFGPGGRAAQGYQEVVRPVMEMLLRVRMRAPVESTEVRRG